MLYISTTFVKDETPIDKALQLCEKLSIQNIELGSNHVYEKDYLKIIYKYSKKNFCVHNYFLRPEKDFVINIASNNNEIRNNSIKHIFKSIDFCDKIGAKLYTFHPGFLTDPKNENKKNKNYDFLYDNSKTKFINYSNTFDQMLKSIDSIINYAKQKKVTIAIETEGSVSKKDHLLLQQPEEFENLKKYFTYNDIKINLNIGHLNLAMNSFKFKYNSLIKIIDKYIIAFELSHNNGINDDHKPLKNDAWYWELISDKRFNNCLKILEFRNTSIKKLENNIKLVKKKLNVL